MAFCFIAIGVSLFKTNFRERAEQLFRAPILMMLFACLFVMPKLGNLLYTNTGYHSPNLLNAQGEFADLDYVTTRESLRIEMVWEARKRIPYLSLSELHKIDREIGVFSSAPISEALCEEQMGILNIRPVDRFDVNRAKRKPNATTNDIDQYFSVVAPK